MATEPFWIAIDLPGRLAIMPRPRSGDWLEDELSFLKSACVDAVVSLLLDDEIAELGLGEEAHLCRAAGIDVLRFPIADRGVPDTAMLRPFVRDLLARIRSGQSVVVHCRAGIGRSSLVAAAIMIEGGATAAAALDSIAAARRLPVPDTQEQHDWLIAYAAR